MIKLEKTEVVGMEAAIRGMRNPMNSWEKSDSKFLEDLDFDPDDYPCGINIGPNDHDLMMRLVKGGPVHAKFRRMIVVYVDITAPLYWWKEFDTYKVGIVANSCSTMHKIHEKEFELGDFSHEHLINDYTACRIEETDSYYVITPADFLLNYIIKMLNKARKLYLETGCKQYWWQMIQLLPTSYNQKRTVMLNYEVLTGIYPMRKDHKLDEWHDFCHWIEELPYSEIIIGKEKEE